MASFIQPGLHSLQLTHVDFMFYEILDELKIFEPTLFDAFSDLKVHSGH